MWTKNLKYLLLALTIAVSGIVVYGTGLYVKYGLLRPAGQDDGVTVIAAPFVYISDEGVRAEVKAYREGSSSPETPGDALSAPATGGSSGEQSPPTPGDQSSPSPPSSAGSSPAAPPASSKPAVTFPPAGEAVNYSLPPIPDLPGVDDSWYEGALFIGDSRAEELKAYAAKPGASYYCAVSMSVFNYTMERIYKTAGVEWGGKPLEQVLSERQYSKIIINLGLNECGYSLARLQEKYTEFVGMVRSKQPGAAILYGDTHGVPRGDGEEAIRVARKYLQREPKGDSPPGEPR